MSWGTFNLQGRRQAMREAHPALPCALSPLLQPNQCHPPPFSNSGLSSSHLQPAFSQDPSSRVQRSSGVRLPRAGQGLAAHSSLNLGSFFELSPYGRMETPGRRRQKVPGGQSSRFSLLVLPLDTHRRSRRGSEDTKPGWRLGWWEPICPFKHITNPSLPILGLLRLATGG